MGRAFATLARCAAAQRELELAETYIVPGLDYCRERGLDTWRLYLLSSRAKVELLRGHWEQATDAIELVLRDPRSAPFVRGIALTTLGCIRARRGDPQASPPLLEERDLAQPTDELARIGPNAAARAEAAWLAGEDAGVLEITEAPLALALKRQSRWLVGELACWRRRAGADERLPPDAAAEPYALSLAGEWSRAAERWRKLGCPYEAALALSDGDEERALREAIERLQALGAWPAATIVTRRLRERGVRGVPRGPRSATRENVAGLTLRELEVLQLLAAGLRNVDIAQRLFVSSKTVDRHVSAILRKLSVRNRGDAAAEAGRLGLLA